MSHLTIVTDVSFEHDIAKYDGLAIVDFWARWCGPCLILGPTVEQLAAEFQGRAKVAKLDVDANPLTADRFAVRSIPTILFFRSGKVVDRVVGIVSKTALAKRLELHLRGGQAAA
jgi:thioredoxin